MNCDCLRKVDIRNFIEVTICCILLSYNLWTKLRSSRSILGFINGFSSYNSVTLQWSTTSWYHDILELFYLLLRKWNCIRDLFWKGTIMDIPTLGRAVALHKYQSRALVVDPGISCQEVKVKEAESSGRILSNKQIRSTTLRNLVPRFVHTFDASYLHCLYSTAFKSKFPVRCLKQSHGGRQSLNETDTSKMFFYQTLL